VLTRTDMIHEFAKRLETLWGYAGHGDVAVHAHVTHALNGRPKQRFVDETVDLTEVDYNLFGPDAWVVPLASRAAEGKVPDWWPPLPLQRR
jgi:vitamin K-dependent gamma-carboxylase